MTRCVSYVLATCNRRQLLKKAVKSILNQTYDDIEIIVISNGSTDGTRELFEDDEVFDQPAVKFYHYDDQLGVSEARNVGYRKSTGDIIVTLDDDAILQNADATKKILDEFEQDPKIGIISFRIENYYTGDIEPDKIPTRDKSKTGYEPFYCAYFLGGGNAIKADVFKQVGYYPSDFTYSFEELDLSYRTIDAGFLIKYVPTVVVIHKAKPKSEGVQPDVLEQYLTNRIKVAIRNLPLRYAISSSLIWTAYICLRNKLNPVPAFNTLFTILRNRKELLSARSVISNQAVEYIQDHDGRLWM